MRERERERERFSGLFGIGALWLDLSGISLI